MDPCLQVHCFGAGTNEYIAEIGGQKKPRMQKGTWDQHRDILRKLYMDENQPLGDVMRIMKEKHNFEPTVKQYRYQLGNRWGWKKYNQNAMRPSRGHNRKRLPRNEASESSEEDVIAASNQFGVPYRDITALRTALKKLFTCKALDQEGLVILRSTSFTVVSEGLRLLFHWCDENIQTDEAQLPPTYGPTEAEAEAKIDMPSNKYGLDAQVFIYLLDRYIGSRYSSSSSLELDGWDKMVDRELGCCPLKMLSIMSTLIVVIVSKALSRCQDDTIAFAPPYIFDVAKLGIGEISRNEWGNEKLVTEFCREFEAILEDHTDYGDAIAAAVSRYVEQKWSGAAQARINEEGLGIGDGSVWNIDWSENNTQDEGPYSMENNSLNGWMC